MDLKKLKHSLIFSSLMTGDCKIISFSKIFGKNHFCSKYLTNVKTFKAFMTMDTLKMKALFIGFATNLSQSRLEISLKNDSKTKLRKLLLKFQHFSLNLRQS